MKITLLKNYNNYFNRQIKREETLSAYINGREHGEFSVDFNPNDGITTSQIINWNYQWSPDYLILSDDKDNIISRWFIMEAKRTRGKQYNLSLKRDVIADFKEDLLDSPIFIDKGTIRDPDSPLLLNNENVSVNQIKRDEIKLFDKTNIPWLVMYLQKGVLGTNEQVTISTGEQTSFEELSTTIEQWDLYEYVTSDYKVAQKVLFSTFVGTFLAASTKIVSVHPDGTATINNASGASNLNVNPTLATVDFLNDYGNAYIEEGIATLTETANSIFGYHSINELAQYNGKVLKDTQGRYFKVSVVSIGSSDYRENVLSNTTSASLYNTMTRIWNTVNSQSVVPNASAFKVQYRNTQVYRIELEELFDLEATLNMQGWTGVEPVKTDAPLYDIICLPYGDIIINNGPSGAIEYHANTSLAIMNSIATQLTSSKVLDLQLLPYCPLMDLSEVGNYFYVAQEETLPIIEDGNTVSMIFSVPRATFSFDINYRLSLKKYVSPEHSNSEAMNVKFQNDCTVLRLCSPNYNGVFEMNIAKNGGVIQGFNVDCTYKPFTPYIHVNPVFAKLYGQDFDDVRGLICGGDFSLGILNSAWNQYEIQNKNYQNIFDRQIQNLDFNNKISMQEAGFGMVAGTLQGATSGAVAGGMVGGGPGAIAGAVVGGASSLIGGAQDLANMASRMREAKNLSIDMYNLNLGNIKALPYSITRTSAITANNKLVPFIEIYSCTDEEREAYFYKLIYEGMTVGIIDKISNWIIDGEVSYLKGRLIRNNSISEDSHLLNSIYEELSMGVYM